MPELVGSLKQLGRVQVTQTAHGLAVGDVIRLSGANYVEAQADSAVNAEVVGVVIGVAGANVFTFQTVGHIAGLSGLTAGVVYYLSPSTPGLLTATEPTTAGQVSKPLLVADTTTSGYLFNFRGVLLTGATGSAGYLTAMLNITGVQFRSLATTPLEIIPAPGAGKIINVISATAREMIAPGVAHPGPQPIRLTYSGTPSLPICQFNPALGSGQENNFAMAGRVVPDDASQLLFVPGGFVAENVAVVFDTEVDLGGSGTISVRVIAHYTIEDYT